MAEPDETETEIECGGCGERVTVTLAGGNPMVLTEPSGRVSIQAGGVVAHQCAEGTYPQPSS